MNDPIQRLEIIADEHLQPSPAQVVDQKMQQMDLEKLLPLVIGPNVLEMGYGDGQWTGRLIERFGRTHIVDASAKLLEEAGRRHGQRAVRFQSLFEVFDPPADLRFNTIVATHILEHVDDPVAVLKRARTWLAPTGRILVVVPNAGSLHRRLAVLMGLQRTVHDLSPRDHEVGHQRVYDLDSLRRDVGQAGFQIQFERGLFLKTLPNGMMTDHSDALLQAMVDLSDELPADWMANLAMLVAPRPA